MMNIDCREILSWTDEQAAKQIYLLCEIMRLLLFLWEDHRLGLTLSD